MSQNLDVYRDWLGIKETNRPLDYYQLLRLKKFEDDTAKIRKNYRQLNAEARKYASGQYGQQSQELLNELARAMLCLTDSQRKVEYDASLGRKEEAKLGRSLEEILIRRKVVDRAQLDKARSYASAVGVDVGEALVQQKFATRDAVMQAYAESVGVPFVDLDDLSIDVELVPQVPALMARQHSCVPVIVDDGQLLMASPNLLPPEVEEELRLRLGMSVRTLLCTPTQVHAVVNEHFPAEAAEAQLAAGGGARRAAAKKTARDDENVDQATGTKKAAQDPDAAKTEQQLVIPLIGAILGFMPALAVFSFIWNPLNPKMVDTPGPLEFAMSAALGAVAGAVTYVVVSSRK